MNPSLYFVLIPTVGASLLAKAASQSTSPQLNTLGQIVGAGLPAMAAYQPTNLPPECTHSNCGSGLAREQAGTFTITGV